MATMVGHAIERARFRRGWPSSTARVLFRERFQTICQRRVALSVRHPFDGQPDSFGGSYQDCQLLGACQARVHLIAAEQQIVLHVYVG
jgi:hypothetical protein